MEANDMKAMREAAVTAYDALDNLKSFSLHLGDVGRMREFNHLVCLAKNRLDAALAKPPRNCDRYTSLDEAGNAYMAINEMPEGNRDEDMRQWLCDFHHWLFAPATEQKGDADENK